GFTDWVGQVADSRSAREYRRRVPDAESASMWQSLSFGANYKAAYCLAVCPAGEDVIAPFLSNRPHYLREVVKPLQDKAEPVYVVPGSDAEAHVTKRFPHKTPRPVRSPLRATSIAGFLFGLRLRFQRNHSDGLTATYHFTFTGEEPRTATIVIRDKTLQLQDGLAGIPEVRVTADSRTWLGVLAKERSLLWALVRGRIRVRGSLRLLRAFGRCFPA
ncbi:MAG TPA: SCP2 sterol-binding domain-containing protein, partial [Candidatus Acidoferrum sp.]|nr:SCP2 sterol-binding domain-containing protein [Candidatus Acidoferrum sp.]